jgi:hypothetical protein
MNSHPRHLLKISSSSNKLRKAVPRIRTWISDSKEAEGVVLSRDANKTSKTAGQEEGLVAARETAITITKTIRKTVTILKIITGSIMTEAEKDSINIRTTDQSTTMKVDLLLITEARIINTDNNRIVTKEILINLSSSSSGMGHQTAAMINIIKRITNHTMMRVATKKAGIKMKEDNHLHKEINLDLGPIISK